MEDAVLLRRMFLVMRQVTAALLLLVGCAGGGNAHVRSVAVTLVPLAATPRASATASVEPAPPRVADTASSAPPPPTWRVTTLLAHDLPITLSAAASPVSDAGDRVLVGVSLVVVTYPDRREQELARRPFDDAELVDLQLRQAELTPGRPLDLGDVVIQDLNFDGFGDLLVARWHSAVGVLFQYWLFDPKKQVLVDTPMMDMLHHMHAIDPVRRTIADWRKSGPGERELRTLQWRESELIPIRIELTHAITDAFYYRLIRVRQKGRLVKALETGRRAKEQFCKFEHEGTVLGSAGHCVAPEK
jgi:hypothetical protein